MKALSLNNVQYSKEDKTRKYRFRTTQKEVFDAATVFFTDADNAPVNICISSQIGCRFHCSFCISGNKPYKRNLTTDEIIAQISCIFEDDNNLSNSKFEITYMGSGDPLDNFDAVVESMLSIQKHQNLSRINVSTIVPSIHTDFSILSRITKKIHLQYSLNFVNDALRKKYLQNNDLPTIEKSLDFLKLLSQSIHDGPCISYILFDNINDSPEDARLLCEYANKINAYIKLSEYIPIHNSPADITLKPSQNYESFRMEIEKQGVNVKPFKSKGIDINAACGHFLSDVVL